MDSVQGSAFHYDRNEESWEQGDKSLYSEGLAEIEARFSKRFIFIVKAVGTCRRAGIWWFKAETILDSVKISVHSVQV